MEGCPGTGSIKENKDRVGEKRFLAGGGGNSAPGIFENLVKTKS